MMNERFQNAAVGNNPVLDFAGVCHLLEKERGASTRVLSVWSKSLEAFARKPVLYFNIYRAQDDNDTQLQIRATLGAAFTNGKLIVVSYYNEILGLTYDKQELVRVDLQPVV